MRLFILTISKKVLIMKNIALPIFLASFAVASTASAEGLNYLSYGASYSNLSIDDETADAFGGGISADFQSGNFLFNGGVNTNRFSSEGESTTLTGVDVRVGYLATADFAVYAGLMSTKVTDLDTFSTYNVGAEFGINSLAFGINYDDSDEDGYVATTIAYGSYRVSDAAEVFLVVSDTDGLTSTGLVVDFDNGQFDAAAFFTEIDGQNMFALDTSYALGYGMRVSGNYINFDSEFDMVSIGAGFEVSQDLWIDLNVGRVEATGSENLDLIGLTLTYEMGGETLLVDRVTSAQLSALGSLGEVVLTSF